MSDTILSTRWVVHYEAENRQKRIVRDTSVTPTVTDTVKDLYLALMTLFHTGNQMDDGSPMSAQTPTEFTIGIIETADDDPWFIDPESVQYLTGGALKTASWKRVESSNTGIVRVNVSASNIVAGDIGYDITHSTTDSGTLLAIQPLDDSGNQELWIRPDDNTSDNSFDATSGTLTCNTHTATQDAASTTGDMQWSNIYNTGIATLVSDTHLYVYQGSQTGDTAPDKLLVEYDLSGTSPVPQDWWSDGTFDILVMVADQSSDLSDRDTFLDEGYISVFARQYSKTYSYYIVDLFAGGRNPIPLETGNDLNNSTGYAQVELVGSSGNWNVGDEIEGQTTNARAIITSINGAYLRFYYIGKSPPIAFNGTEQISNNDDTGDSTSSQNLGTYGPAALSGLSITYGADETFDVDDDGTNELFSIVIDVSDETLADAYEWVKWLTRRGDTTTTNTDDIEGEQYIGNDTHLSYSSLAGGTWTEGDVVYGQTTGARGTVVADHTTDDELILRNTRGTFSDAEVLGDAPSTPTVTADIDTVRSITPVKSCPFGIFAGGKWFLAPGVVVDNRQSADANNYECTDDLGNTGIAEPVQVSLVIGNTRVKDWVTIHRLTGSGGIVEKTYYSIDTGGSGHAKGDNLVKVDPAIRVDEPGKSVGGGVVVVYDVAAGREDVYHYLSWSGDEFILDQTVSGSAAAGGDTNTLKAASGLSNLRVGELVRDTTDDNWAYVTEVTSDTSVETTTKATAWTTSNGYVANDLVDTYTGSDKVYVPLMYVYETVGTDGSPGSISVSMVYNATVYGILRGRHAGDTSYNLKPGSVPVTIGSSGLAADLIRNSETITS